MNELFSMGVESDVSGGCTISNRATTDNNAAHSANIPVSFSYVTSP